MSRIRLPAKLTRPRLHGAVERVRLFDTLDLARETRRAICVVGPPGAGKTTLVASWLDARAMAGIWFQVDAGDADLPTFFHYLGQAGAPHGRRGQAPLPALTAEYLADVEGFSRRFFRALFERLPEGCAVVLDNYQEVEPGSALHRLVADAVEELPEGVVLVVISRRDPPQTYARLMANENVAVVDWEGLRLTLEESRAIATARSGLPEADIAVLHERCGGWAAGLTLMMESRRRSSAMEDAPPGNEAVFAYFADQILDRLPEATQRVLAMTAFLQQVAVPVARGLTGEAHVDEILEDLHRRQLFTHRRAGTHPVYGYHALFRDFLRARALRQLGPEAVNDVLRKAAALLEAGDGAEDAVELYREARDWEAVARLSGQLAAALLARGRTRALQEWIGALPPERLARSPWLRYWLGVSLTPTDPVRARSYLEPAFADFGSVGDGRGQALAAAAVIDAHVHEWNDFRAVRPWVDALATVARQRAPGDDPVFEQRVLCNLLMAMMYVAPGHAMLPTVVERVDALLDADLGDHGRLAASMNLLAYCNLVADPARMARAVACGAALVTGPDVTPAMGMWWHIRLGLYLAVEGRYRESIEALDRADVLARDHGLHHAFALNCLSGTYRMVSATALGDARLVRLHAGRMIDTATSGVPMARFQALYGTLHLALVSDDMAAVAAIADTGVAVARETGMDYLELLVQLHRATALALLRRREALAACLSELRALVTGTCFERTCIDAELVAAWDALEAGERDSGLERLSAALRRWRESGGWHASVVTFAASRPIREILAIALREGIEPAFVTRAVQHLRIHPPSAPPQRWPWAVSIRALGDFEVRLRGDPLRFEGKQPRKPLAVLKAIVAFGPAAVPVSRIVAALWPDDDGDVGRRSFDVAIARLRKLLECPEALVVGEEKVGLDVRLCWVDAQRFLDLTGDREADATALEAACSLYRGAFLPTDVDQPWSVSRRELLRTRFTNAVQRIATDAERRGRTEDALAWYRRGIEADELAESFHQGVMRCLLALDRQAEAASAYRRLRQLLSVVLGIQPSVRSMELARQAGLASVGDR